MICSARGYGLARLLLLPYEPTPTPSARRRKPARCTPSRAAYYGASDAGMGPGASKRAGRREFAV